MDEVKRNTVEIRVWMYRQKITGADIARAVGIALPLVTMTIRGDRNNRKVLRYLVDAGCPVELLGLPDDIRKVA